MMSLLGGWCSSKVLMPEAVSAFPHALASYRTEFRINEAQLTRLRAPSISRTGLHMSSAAATTCSDDALCFRQC